MIAIRVEIHFPVARSDAGFFGGPGRIRISSVKRRCAYLKSLGAKSFKQRRHVNHSWAVLGDSK
jgi:hypothetical protein